MKTVKAAANSITDVDLGKRTAVTAFATYKSLDRDKDRSFKGMFTKSWNEFPDTRVFLNHDKTQAPGKIFGDDFKKSLWEDDNHAYAKMWFSTSTLGEDTLKSLSEGIYKDSSFWFVPTKYEKNAEGGFNLREVLQKDVSVLSHWGAHPESKIVSVQKAASDLQPGEAILKQLSTDEISFLRDFITGQNNNLISLAAFAAGLPESSDIYTWVNSILSDLSYSISRFKGQLVWGQKSWSYDELTERLSRLKSFCKNTTASDECIQNVLKEAEGIESLIMMADTPEAAQPKEQFKSKDNDSDNLQLLNIKLLLS